MNNDDMVEKAKFEKWAESLWPNITIFACQECGPWHYEDGLTQKLWESWQASARSAVRDAVRECIATCEAVAVNLAQFHSTMPAGARECASALRKKFEVEDGI